MLASHDGDSSRSGGISMAVASLRLSSLVKFSADLVWNTPSPLSLIHI